MKNILKNSKFDALCESILGESTNERQSLQEVSNTEDEGSAKTYQIVSVKHKRNIEGDLATAIQAAKEDNETYQPAYGVQVEDMEGNTVYDTENIEDKEDENEEPKPNSSPNGMKEFKCDGETYLWDEENKEVMASKGETIKYDSIESFCADAKAEGGAENLSGWEY